MAGNQQLVDGTTRPGFERVREVFEEVVAGREGTGCALAVWHQGEWVVDLWGGYADLARTRPWQRDTIAMPYSVTKPFAAVCALLLADRGEVALDAPVATYWPELTAEATLRQVLSHQAGVVVLEQETATETLYDWDAMCALVAAQRPLWRPGTAHGESALLYGYLLGEVVRRVTGSRLGSFLREHVGTPYGLDFHIGLGPAEERRVADLSGFDEQFRRRAEEYDPMFLRALDNPPGALDPAVVNSSDWRRAEIAAVNGHGTARAVAGLYVALTQRGLLSADLLADATRVHAKGRDRVLGSEAQWGLGFGVDADGFGMGGTGGSFGWWSEVGQYAFGYVTAHVADHEPGDRLENALRACLSLPPV